MNRSDVESLTLRVDDANTVSGLLLAPSQARACYVLAHGAGAGMFHPFMEAVARELAQRGIATLRYQFPYMEQGANGPTLPSLRMPRFEPRWGKPVSSCRHSHSSPAANPSVAA
jgi:predicted alpha/beta-hydrolase family hydrolase